MQATPEQPNGSNGEEISVISLTENAGQPGRPTKQNEQTIASLCKALSDGMPIKSACAVAGISVQTLSNWRKDNPQIETRIEAAKEALRQKAWQAIGKAISADDWRAAVEALKLAFPEYRQNAKVEVSANASAVSGFPVLTLERQRELQERWARLRANE